MSAYICDNLTISVVAKAFVEYGVEYHNSNFKPKLDLYNVKQDVEEIGQSLLESNYDSVNYRYSENTPYPKFNYQDIEINEGLVYGCLSCYDYQASEPTDYYNSELYYSLMNLKHRITIRLLKNAGMSAPYGYYGHDILCRY